MSERELSAAGYVLAFLSDVENLTNNYAGYFNLIMEYKAKYPTPESLRNVDPNDQNHAQQLVQQVRFWTARVFIKYMALVDHLPGFKEKETEIKGLYAKLKQTSNPTLELLEEYSITINKLFADNIVADVLIKSKDIYSKMFGQETPGAGKDGG